MAIKLDKAPAAIEQLQRREAGSKPPAAVRSGGSVTRRRDPDHAGILSGLFKTTDPAFAAAMFSTLQSMAGAQDGKIAAVRRGAAVRHAPKPVARERLKPIPEPPMSLGDYLENAHRAAPEMARYDARLEKYIESNDLSSFKDAQNDRYLMGTGGSKHCYRINGRYVLVVLDKAGTSITDQVKYMKFLEKAGFPMGKIRTMGKIPDKFGDENDPAATRQALIMEHLHNFVTFERMTKEMKQDFLDSPYLSEKTLESLLQIRDLMKKHKVAIRDLQGAMGDDGGFRITDPNGIDRLSEPSINHKKSMKNLDDLIQAVAERLGRPAG